MDIGPREVPQAALKQRFFLDWIQTRKRDPLISNITQNSILYAVLFEKIALRDEPGSSPS